MVTFTGFSGRDTSFKYIFKLWCNSSSHAEDIDSDEDSDQQAEESDEEEIAESNEENILAARRDDSQMLSN
jgi:hypothetical protein